LTGSVSLPTSLSVPALRALPYFHETEVGIDNPLEPTDLDYELKKAANEEVEQLVGKTVTFHPNPPAWFRAPIREPARVQEVEV
jgi:hypothetical protein